MIALITVASILGYATIGLGVTRAVFTRIRSKKIAELVQGKKIRDSYTQLGTYRIPKKSYADAVAFYNEYHRRFDLAFATTFGLNWPVALIPVMIHRTVLRPMYRFITRPGKMSEIERSAYIEHLEGKQGRSAP